MPHTAAEIHALLRADSWKRTVIIYIMYLATLRIHWYCMEL